MAGVARRIGCVVCVQGRQRHRVVAVVEAAAQGDDERRFIVTRAWLAVLVAQLAKTPAW